MELILASNSPRRRELLEKLGALFTVVLGDFEENGCSLDPIVTAESFAFGKAKSVFDKLENTEKVIVLGSDTVVYHNGEILGKPVSKSDAERMLKALSGKPHEVYTGVCVLYPVRGGGRELRGGAVCTKVKFFPLTKAQIKAYVATGSPMDKAGAYGIQDGGLVESIEGSFSNVVGLPVEFCKELIESLR